MSDNLQSNERQRFFLLGDDSESDSDSESYEPNRRLSTSSNHSDLDLDVIGGPPSNLEFILDDDSGLGMSLDGSSFEDSERNSLSSGDQILPLRNINIGNHHQVNEHHRQQSTRRGKRHRFQDFYTLRDDQLGQGAYASVRTCVSLTTGKEFAVKLVDKHEPGHTRSRILREVEIFKMCKGHPNFVQLIEWFEDPDRFYLVFEKALGGSLLSFIQRRVCFTEQEASQVTKDIANALSFLHSKGIAHRDIKPENILCSDSDKLSVVKLCDLDLASKPAVPSMRRTSRQLHSVQSEPDLASPVGSAEFLAPEVVDLFIGESQKYDRRCDLWSLGVITYIMLCGYVPFYGECDREDCGWNQGQPCDQCQDNLFMRIQNGIFDFPEEEWGKISDEAKDLISHLLVKNARQRYTAQQVLNHPWIACGAPETPLQTANNLFRNDSARDIHQMNQHFAMNHFTARLSSRVEETIPSVASTPEEESTVAQVFDPESTIVEATKRLEEHAKKEPANEIMDQQPQVTYYNQPPPQMINMNGLVIFAPPMAAPNPQAFMPPPPMQFVNQPGYYPQPIFAMPPQFYSNLNHPQQQQHQQSHGGQMRRSRNNAQRTQRSLTPGYYQQVHNGQGGPQRKGSLRTAMSQLGLENCQNAMIRQVSSGKELHHGQTREAQVNV